jgi:hypothetical protein
VKKLTASGYIAVDGRDKSTGGVRACLHDAVINAAKQIGVTIDKLELLKQCSAVKIDRTFEQVTSTEAVSTKVKFTNVNVDNAPGGNEVAMLSIEDGGVYVLQMQVDGKRTELHAGVYDSCGTLPGHGLHSGMLIDNRKKAPIYLIEPKDRASTKAKRDMLNDFYNVKHPGRVFVLQVWRIEPVEGVEITPVPTVNYPSAAYQDAVAAIKEQQSAAVKKTTKADAQGIVDYKRKQRESGIATGPYDNVGGHSGAAIDLTDSPPAKKMKVASSPLDNMTVEELQAVYKDKLNVTQVRGPSARNKKWLIDKINGGMTIRAKRAQKQGGSPNKRARN